MTKVVRRGGRGGVLRMPSRLVETVDVPKESSWNVLGWFGVWQQRTKEKSWNVLLIIGWVVV